MARERDLLSDTSKTISISLSSIFFLALGTAMQPVV
jgi:hypothetical protein